MCNFSQAAITAWEYLQTEQLKTSKCIIPWPELGGNKLTRLPCLSKVSILTRWENIYPSSFKNESSAVHYTKVLGPIFSQVQERIKFRTQKIKDQYSHSGVPSKLGW